MAKTDAHIFELRLQQKKGTLTGRGRRYSGTPVKTALAESELPTEMDLHDAVATSLDSNSE